MARGVPDANGNKGLSGLRGSPFCNGGMQKRQRSARITGNQMAFPEFPFLCVAVTSDSATETTIRIHLMSQIHMSQLKLKPLIHESLVLHGGQRGHLKIRHLKHQTREIRSNRMKQQRDVLFVNHKILEIQSNRNHLLILQIQSIRTMQRSDVLFESDAIHEIPSNRSRLLIRMNQSIRSRLLIHKNQLIRQNFHVIHKNRWNDGKDQLQTDLQKQSFQPKHPNKPNDPIS